MSDTCKSCGSKILWSKTAAGKAIPLDPDPLLIGGNILLNDDGSCVVVGRGNEGNRNLYVSHFATCPQAASHRRKSRP